MEKTVRDILDALRHGDLDAKQLDLLIRAESKRLHDGRKRIAKKHILPYYLQVKRESGSLWKSWDVDEDLDKRFVKTLQMKPRRSASGVATITVITKPWPCSNDCIYCPNDERMPKSYLSDEPACQRAERNRFDPFLQVASRLRTLHQMGHATDKIELIVLGGTWLDYPPAYRTWFVHELYRALNASEDERLEALERMAASPALTESGCSEKDILEQQALNEAAQHRMVGLVVETRPDTITPEALTSLRFLGCTKIQLGVQSIRNEILAANGRHETDRTIGEAFELCRLFGFKIHAHFMLNLLGSTPESDIEDFRVFASDAPYQPDEVKLYPCALVDGTQLLECYRDGTWRPYTEDELVDVLSRNLIDTPPFMRVSRMIRDISAKDILAGNKKTNLRQLVEGHIRKSGYDTESIQEIRFREVGTRAFDRESLALSSYRYETSATTEVFLQWVTTDNSIAGFLRLSLPHESIIRNLAAVLPVQPGEAMIREVHVYGFATNIDQDGSSAQHKGLGRLLVEEACKLAHDAGYTRINVISAIGTRAYYRKLGFVDSGLYQQRLLD